ncbi:MAG: autotransporter domain-containing protein [Alphaproteobacteria bacterium]
MLIRRLLPFLCAMGLFLAVPALAQTTIDGKTDDPITTSVSGDIFIGSNGAVSINQAGAAVTIDSENFVTNNGLISNKSSTGAIGVLLQGGGEESAYTQGGTISLDGKNATGGIGIEVAPAGYTGPITLQSGSTVSVTGDDSIGLAIFGPLLGDIRLAGTVIVIGENATGLLSTAPITGAITNNGSITALGAATTGSAKSHPPSGPAMAIGASVSGGIYNAGPEGNETGIARAVMSSFGDAPTLLISPSLAGAGAQDIVIGILDDPANADENFSILNRGVIAANGLDPGVDATAILISGDGSGHTVLLEGGLFNAFVISALANSGDTQSTADDANSIAIEIASGATATRIVNEGQIAATTSGLGGGTATAILVDEGGSLGSLENSGVISATITLTEAKDFEGTLIACTICDLSGTLTTLKNSGTISATTTDASDASIVTIAADLSHAASGTSIVFVNTGQVTGDILFGASNDTLDIGALNDGGTVEGNVAFGAGTNSLTIIGAAGEQSVFSGAISYDAGAGGTLNIDVFGFGVLSTPSADASTLNVAAGGTVIFVLGSEAPALGEGIITTTGNAVFAGNSIIGFGFDSSLPDSGNYTLLHAGGNLIFGTDGPVLLLSSPYIYAIDIDIPDAAPNELVASFQRKTATELELKGNHASIYGAGDLGTDSYVNSPLMQAARSDSELGAALMRLTKEEDFISALDSLMPDVSGGTRAIAIMLTDQATGPVGARQQTLLEYANSTAGLNLWGQEYFSFLTDDGSSSSAPGFEGKGFGFAVGADGGAPRDGRFGGALSFFAGNVTENRPRDSKTNVKWLMASLYSNWRGRVLFFNTHATGGHGTFKGSRDIEVGDLKRTARGKWSDYLAAGGISTGFIFNAGSLLISPYLNIDALYVSENAYDEGGAGGASLDIDSRDQRSLRTFLGLRLRQNFELEGGFFQPELRGGWSHDFLNDPAEITASFTDASNPTAFTITGPVPDASRFVAGTSFTWAYRSWSLGFNYDIMAGSRAQAHTGVITLTGRI